MRLKRETEVAVAILIACAKSGGCRLKTAEAASAAGVSTDYAAQIALKLVNSGFFSASRGRNGGLDLARPATGILLGEVIGVWEDRGVTAEEWGGSLSSATSLEKIVTRASCAARTYLDQFSIGDLADAERPLRGSQRFAAENRAPRSVDPVSSVGIAST